jgi:hypothetical protein
VGAQVHQPVGRVGRLAGGGVCRWGAQGAGVGCVGSGLGGETIGGACGLAGEGHYKYKPPPGLEIREKPKLDDISHAS